MILKKVNKVLINFIIFTRKMSESFCSTQDTSIGDILVNKSLSMLLFLFKWHTRVAGLRGFD